MKNKIYPSFEEAIADIGDGAVIAFSTFGTASQALNLWEALYNKDVKGLTLIGNMVMPVRDQGPLVTYVPSHCVLQPGKVKRVIIGFTSAVYTSRGSTVDTGRFAQAMKSIEVIPTTFGTICTHLEAASRGYGGILTPVGIGTFLEEKMKKHVIDGREYLLVKPIVPDFGFVKAQKADKLGNLYYRRGQRVHNPLVASASRTTIAEALEIVEPGEIDPDHIHTPHIYVDRIVRVLKGGKGTPEWEEVSKALQYGPGGAARLRSQAMPGRGS